MSNPRSLAILILGCLYSSGVTAQTGAVGTSTYWQGDACTPISLGENAQLLWCVDAVDSSPGGPMELRVAWRVAGVLGGAIDKGPDTENANMYLTDDLGNRYDHVATKGAAETGGSLDQTHRLLEGVFVFPPLKDGASRLTLHDADQHLSISNIVLSSDVRTDTAASTSVLGSVAEAEAIHIDYSWTGLGARSHDQFDLRRAAGGFAVSGLRLGNEPISVPIPEIPWPSIRPFLNMLMTAPLLEREYQPTITHTDDYPSITVKVSSTGGEVTFFSQSQGEGHVPWGVEVQGKSYVVPDDTPARALEILDPFFGRDPASRAMRALEPAIGEQRATELWSRLESEVGPKEAYRLVRNIQPRLGGEEEADTLRALDAYLEELKVPTPPPGPQPGKVLPSGDTELAQAARQGDTEKLQALLEQGDDANEASPLDGETPLGAAVVNGHSDAVALLVAAGADVNHSLASGESPLIRAVRANRDDMMSTLLANGAEVDVRGRGGLTPLMLAAQNGRAATVKKLLEAGANANVQNIGGDTALSLATLDHRASVVRTLLARGANPNLGDRSRMTPLMKTADPDIARTLIRAGARVDAVDENGLTPMMALAFEGRAPQQSTETDRAGTLQALLTAGAAVNARDREGQTAMILMTRESANASELVQLLIQEGADVDAQDRQGRAALIHAVAHNDVETVRILIEAGANLNVSLGNASALALALRYGHSDVVTLLLRAGAKR